MKNQNTFRYTPNKPKFPDGREISLPIDQFPVSDKSLFKDDGFPANEIDILDRFSRNSNIDEDFVKMVAQRIEALPEEKSDDLSIEQKIRLLRPAWCQTPSEYAAYSEAVYQYMSEQSSISSDVKEQVTAEVEEVSPSDSPVESKIV